MENKSMGVQAAMSHKIFKNHVPAHAAVEVEEKGHADFMPDASDETEEKPWLEELSMKNVNTLHEYLDCKKADAILSLILAKLSYEEFKKELPATLAGLTSLTFGFTLETDGSLMVLDLESRLTADQRQGLTTELNKANSLKKHIIDHAETVLKLIKHDKKEFGERYNVQRSDIANTLDYRKILNSEDMSNEWIYQVKLNTPLLDTKRLLAVI